MNVAGYWRVKMSLVFCKNIDSSVDQSTRVKVMHTYADVKLRI